MFFSYRVQYTVTKLKCEYQKQNPTWLIGRLFLENSLEVHNKNLMTGGDCQDHSVSAIQEISQVTCPL